MATHLSTHNVRVVATHIRHALFPSRYAVLVALLVEVTALVGHIAPPAHVVVAIAAHLAIAAVYSRR